MHDIRSATHSIQALTKRFYFRFKEKASRFGIAHTKKANKIKEDIAKKCCVPAEH